MDISNKYTINPEDENRRIDLFLSKNDSTYSRSVWKKLISDGYVLLNDKKTKSSSRLKSGDEIKVLPYDKNIDIDLEIIYQDDNIIVINKPSGVITHAKSELEDEPSVASFVRDKITTMPDIRSGIVHRLDRDTSGVMVVARNQESFEHLKQQFQDRTTSKWYIALVDGLISADMKIDGYINRSNKKGSFITSDTGKHATTLIFPLKQINNKTLVLIRPITGRTHQIRVHLKSVSHPILGDQIYNRKNRSRNRYDRLMLHAWKLKINTPVKGDQEFIADIPESMSKYIDDETIAKARYITSR